MIKRTKTETASADTKSGQVPATETDLTKVKRRRRPRLWVASILLVTVGSLLMGSVVMMVQDTVPVVATSMSVARGEPITEEHLSIVQVHPEPGLVTVPASQRDELIGQVAITDIPTGQLINPDALGEQLIPGDGQALVGVAVTPPQRPAGEITPGTVVQLVSTPRSGDDPPESEPLVSVEGTVVSVSSSADTNLTVVDVSVPADAAELLAALSATGRVALIVKEI